MNFKDVLDEITGLQEDHHKGEVFGDLGQVTVVGWSGWYRDTHKYYVIYCTVCAKDPDLFGEGYFRVRYSNLSKSKSSLPCGCLKHNWSKEQYKIIVERRALTLGYSFVGFKEENPRSWSKIILNCGIHGDWDTTAINNFLYKSQKCPFCVKEENSYNLRSSTQESYIEDFRNFGGYPEGSEFWRSERKNTQNCMPFWYTRCSDCNEVTEAHQQQIKLGIVSCSCKSSQIPTHSYIFVIEEDSIPVALKFGITKNIRARAYNIRIKTKLTVRFLGSWCYPTGKDCRSAERKCREMLQCGVLDKQTLKDGHTETTWVYNLDKIIEIYESSGGTRQDVKFRSYREEWKLRG